MEFGFRSLSLDSPHVMGVLNVTPDSFSDGGAHYSSGKVSLDRCLASAAKMAADGASFIDIGGESTRPGAEPVSLQEEMDRVLPVVEAIAKEIDVIVSVDTSSPELMRASAKLGAGLINDVRALEREGALSAVAESSLPVCLMHMQGVPKTMQTAPDYSSVVAEVSSYLMARIKACRDAGIGLEKVLIDPGIGFGKSDEHNLELLRELTAFNKLNCSILLGVSRKSMIGRLLNRDTDQRLAGSLAFAMESVRRGAKIIRVHDVAETVDVIKVCSLMNKEAR